MTVGTNPPPIDEEDDDFDADAFIGMDATAREALLRGTPPAAPAATPDPVTPPAPAPVAVDPSAPLAPPEDDGMPPDAGAGVQPPPGYVPQGAMYEERRKRQDRDAENAQLRDQNGQLMALIAQLQGGGQQQPAQPAPEAPRLMHEDPAAVEHIVRQRIEAEVAPIRETHQTLQQMLAAAQEREAINYLAQQHQDPHLPAILADFDSQVPQFRGLPPAARYFMALGMISRSPQQQAQQQQATQQQAREMAVGMASQQLTAPQRPAPVDLGSIPPARSNESPLSIDDVDPDAYARMPPEKRQALLRGV